VVESLQLQLLAPADWRALRAVRLKALLDSPHAFASSYARESGWGEPEWRRQLDAATWVIARASEEVIGLARSISEPESPAIRHIESIWVAPTYRRQGVCRTLLRAIAEIECRKGVNDLLLWVLEDNSEAQCAYAALGFNATGEQQFLPTADRFEHRLRLGIEQLASEQARQLTRIADRSANTDLRPGLQSQKVHGLMGGVDIVDAVGKLLPVGEVLPPGVEKVNAEICGDGLELTFGGR
jgi:ribosomal protein S18 acetylase RimI-like enzyme